ncbi:MAG: hypothetical protein HYZ53_25300 [Planctomycetes bacterium]|nr:hypothetical protein [Planctomycetota bacterium]
MYHFCFAIGLGSFGRETVGGVQRFLAARNAGQGVPFLAVGPELLLPRASGKDPDPAAAGTASRAGYHQLLEQGVERVYEVVKRGITQCEAIREVGREKTEVGPRQKIFHIYLIANLADPLASGILFDMASLAASAAAPWRARILGILNATVFFREAAQEREDCANVYATMRELDSLMASRQERFGFHYERRISVSPRQRPFDLVYVNTGENPAGALKDEEEMAACTARFVGHCLTSPLGTASEHAVEDAGVLDLFAPWKDGRKPAAYSGWGLAMLEVPTAPLKRYCVLRFAAELARRHLVAKPAEEEIDTGSRDFLAAWKGRFEDLEPALASSETEERLRPRIPPLNGVPLGDRGETLKTFDGQAAQKLAEVEATIARNAERLLKARAAALTASVDRLVRTSPLGLMRVKLSLSVLKRLLAEERIKALKKTREGRETAVKFVDAQARLAEASSAWRTTWGLKKLLLKKKIERRIEQLQLDAVTELEKKYTIQIAQWVCDRAAGIYEELDKRIDQEIQALGACGEVLEQVGARFAEEKVTAPPPPAFTDLLAVAPSEYAFVYDKLALERRPDAERAKELGFLLKNFNPLSSWRKPAEAEITNALRGYAEYYFRGLDALDVVKEILGDKRFELAKVGIPHLVEQMGSRAEPFFAYQPELTAGSGNVLDLWVLGTAGAESFAAYYKSAWERAVDVVETRDPRSLFVCRFRHGVPLFALPHLAEFKKKYDLLRPEESRPCYVLGEPDALPEL